MHRADAHRVFLAVDVLSIEESKNLSMLEQLCELVPYFKQEGFEVGVWFWTFWRADLDQVSRAWTTVDADGKPSIDTATALENMSDTLNGFCCPSDPDFVAAATGLIVRIAATGPDILMLDDDFKLGSFGGHFGCFCDRHLRLTSQKLGKTLSRETLAARVYEGLPTPERHAWCEAMGESWEHFASGVGFERGYTDRHLRHKDIYRDIERIFRDKACIGVRVVEKQQKVADADLRAVRILADQGIDVDVTPTGERNRTSAALFPLQGEYVNSGQGEHPVSLVSLAPGAEVLSYAVSGETQYPDLIRYENANGQRFLILAWKCEHPIDRRYCNYAM